MAKQYFAVWGCGVWPERGRVVPDGEPMEPICEDDPEFDFLPADFVREWGENLGSQHWAERVWCEEADLDAATRFSANVYGFSVARRIPVGT